MPESLDERTVRGGRGESTSSRTGATLNLPAIVLIALMTMLLVIGIKESARFNNVIVFIKVAIVFLVIGFGFMYVNTANWHPFIPVNTGEFGEFGWSGVLRGAGVVFFAYIGFDAVSTAAQEAKNPQRDMPIGILGSLVVCTVLYILMALVMTGMVHYSKLNDPAPILVAVAAAGPVARVAALRHRDRSLAGLASVVLVMLMGQPRIFFSMARDGLLPAGVRQGAPEVQDAVHHDDPHGHLSRRSSRASSRSGCSAQLVSIGTLLAFVIVCAGVWILRVRSPKIPRAFRTPLVPLVPILGILICVALDGRTARRHVDPTDRLDGPRPGDLLRVRHEALAPRPRSGSGRAERWVTDPHCS